MTHLAALRSHAEHPGSFHGRTKETGRRKRLLRGRSLVVEVRADSTAERASSRADADRAPRSRQHRVPPPGTPIQNPRRPSRSVRQQHHQAQSVQPAAAPRANYSWIPSQAAVSFYFQGGRGAVGHPSGSLAGTASRRLFDVDVGTRKDSRSMVRKIVQSFSRCHTKFYLFALPYHSLFDFE